MQVIELTLGAEEKRPGQMQYSSDTRSAFVKLAVHPGDDLAAVIAFGKDALARALGASSPTVTIANAPQAPARRGYLVRVRGGRPADTRFRSLKLRWQSDHHEAEVQTEGEATKLVAAIGLMGSGLECEILPPTGG